MRRLAFGLLLFYAICWAYVSLRLSVVVLVGLGLMVISLLEYLSGAPIPFGIKIFRIGEWKRAAVGLVLLLLWLWLFRNISVEASGSDGGVRLGFVLWMYVACNAFFHTLLFFFRGK